MSIMTYDLSFFFKNIQKSHDAVSAHLNAFADGPYDFLFFQEIQSKTYHHVADINHLNGIEVFGLPIHPDWICLPTPARDEHLALSHLRISDSYQEQKNWQTTHSNMSSYHEHSLSGIQSESELSLETSGIACTRTELGLQAQSEHTPSG